MRKAILTAALPASVLLVLVLCVLYWVEVEQLYPDPPPKVPVEKLLEQPFESLEGSDRSVVIDYYMRFPDPKFIEVARREMERDEINADQSKCARFLRQMGDEYFARKVLHGDPMTATTRRLILSSIPVPLSDIGRRAAEKLTRDPDPEIRRRAKRFLWAFTTPEGAEWRRKMEEEPGKE